MCFFAQMTVIVMFVISIKTSIFVCNNKHYLKMATKKQVVLPKHSKLLEQMGENIKLARKRRKLTTIQVAERAGIVRSTLYIIEKGDRSEEHTSELQSLMRSSYAVICLKKKKQKNVRP